MASNETSLLRIGTTIAKRIHSSPPDGDAWLRPGPFGGIGDYLDTPFVQLDLRIDGLDTNGSWDPTQLEGEGSFDDASDAAC